MREFRAYTIVPDQLHMSRLGIVRDRPLDSLTRNPTDGTIGVISGPPKSGRSTLALQWVTTQHQPIQYISANPDSILPDELLLPPSPLGQSLASRLSCLIRSGQHDIDDDRYESIQRLVKEWLASGEQFVLDEMPSAAAQLLVSILSMDQITSDFRQSLIVLGSGSIEYGAFEGLGHLRLINGRALSFTPEETAQYLESQSRSLPDSLALWQATFGWIGGIDALVGDYHTIHQTELQIDTLVRDQLLLHLDRKARSFVLTAAMIPRISSRVLKELLAAHGLEESVGLSFIMLLPCRVEAAAGGSITIAPAVREAMCRLAPTYPGGLVPAKSLGSVITTMIEEEDYPSAFEALVRIDPALQMTEVVAESIVTNFVRGNWDKLDRLISSIPDEVLVASDRLAYWSCVVDILHARPMRPVLNAHVLTSRWQESDDPEPIGWMYLMTSQRRWVQCQFEESRLAADLAVPTIPVRNPRNLILAATMGIRASHAVGNRAELARWREKYHSVAQGLPRQRGWLEDITAFYVIGTLITDGQLGLAQRTCERAMDRLRATNPRFITVHSLMRSLIAIERLDFQSAHLYLDQARELSALPITDTLIPYVDLMCAIAQEDWVKAHDLLNGTVAIGLSFADFRHSIELMRIQCLLAQGDHSTALVELDYLPRYPEYWPRVLGEEHEAVLRSLACYAVGDYRTALSLAEKVAKEAQIRGHMYHAVRATSVLAHIYHHMGDQAKRNAMIQQAIAKAGKSGFQRPFLVLGHDVRKLVITSEMTPLTSDSVSQPVSGEFAVELTDREIDVLKLLAEGYKHREVAARLFVSPFTVRAHARNINQKLHTSSRVDAVNVARKRGLI